MPMLALVWLGFGISAHAEEGTAAKTAPSAILIETSMGNIEVQLDAEKAPITVDNFRAYITEGFYAGTLFHRVIPNFMIQGGGMDESFSKKTTRDAIKIEANNGLNNDRGTIAMARTNAPNSATSQFFINLIDNAMLNHTAESTRGWGYTVFGKVTKGMDIVDAIAKVETGVHQGRRDVPKTPVVIKNISLI
ncbi:MAG TPA: peptidyl-prolyl cis-trans isomerase [Chromatiaceae bacterium]|nr:peptidyl-prolyl cis-trans isomerase [Chromatiaceae bacterium]HIA08457.1 peptidyl-prolyl cis-trans isomerase [Chromatiaceae bacterium]HIN82021.1 peptidyl-prolyl cis-trans isomerase [Chromatiales bacterium]HIO14984.1 peptidyl-prolyl cis-trans isomerase [Chromatiales bacterium]HIO55333.1 peptidyl-prolyl cis-trans isomerase [Chromatiales bacterium]